MRSRARMLLVMLATISGLLVPAGIAHAGPAACTFTVAGTTMTLNANCTTTTTILIPAGYTLDGNHHTITAADPAGGHFLGAVVRNAGTTANVEDLTITTSALSNVCDAGADRLRGIMFDGAGGSITGNTVTNINQGQSGCQEGDAINVRNAPFDGTHPATRYVTISDNTVTAYQKTGIVANGDVEVEITGNTVVGAGPVGYIAQNGIQVGFGGIGTVSENAVSANWYTGPGWTSTGILVTDTDGASVSDNQSGGDQTGVYVFGGGTELAENQIGGGLEEGDAAPSEWGIILWGDANEARENEVVCSSIGIDVFGNDNAVRDNQIAGASETSPCQIGILVEKDVGVGTGNVLEENEFENVVQEVVDPQAATPLASPAYR